MSSAFDLVDVTYSYPRATTPALSGISLRLPRDGTTVLLGPSGSGKSTLMYLLGLLWEGQLDHGHIHYFPEPELSKPGVQQDYASLTHADRARLRLNDFGFVLQSAYLLPYFSCGYNVSLPLQVLGCPPGQQQAQLEQMFIQADPTEELFRVRDRLPGEVSGGQRQRMAVLRAVIHNPRVVFADEPFNNLDPENANLIIQLLLDWREGKLHESHGQDRTLILVCHDLEIARTVLGRKVADHIVLLDKTHHAVGNTCFPVCDWDQWEPLIHRAFRGESVAVDLVSQCTSQATTESSGQ